MSTTTYRIKGINSDTDTCECCGRTGLKRVVWLAPVVDDTEYDPAAYGSSCAAVVMGRGREAGRKVVDEALAANRAARIAAAERAERAAWYAELAEALDAGRDYVGQGNAVRTYRACLEAGFAGTFPQFVNVVAATGDLRPWGWQ